MEERPTAVHSVQTELYSAARMLFSLPTGIGYCSYVGRNGPVATLFSVPPIFSPDITPVAYAAVRDELISESGSAVPVEEAERIMRERETRVFVSSGPAAERPKRRTVSTKTFDGPEQGSAW
jgi:hypothetical protein